MKLKFLALLLVALTLPFTAYAQGGGSDLYVVAEGGVVKNTMALRGALAGLTKNETSEGSFGAAIGYRTLVADNFILGFEGSIASSSASSSVTDGLDTITFDENYVAGLYLTGGFAFGDQNQALFYGLLGVGFVGGDTSVSGVFTGNQTIDDSGNGISFGGAFEYGFSEDVGARIKVLHTRYKGDVDELKIRDTSIMGGLVYSF